jgi:hypothetical protein
MPSGEEINEWVKRLMKEGICSIVHCLNETTRQCKKCTIYYCSEHFPSHLDLLPDIGDDLDYDSSNKGLEIIWMLITKERKMIFPYIFHF